MQLSRIDTNGRLQPGNRASCATLWPFPQGQKMRREVTNTESKIGEFL
ncbi:hypothetical protein QNH00_gp26 [Yersinia phage PYps16N]|uniref:Uncharacterized protein n=1 Tax=Yersinia phage PYps16N TaxID=2801354 RepID=A0AAE7PAC7_9CAUD|nr:hypothetical protein QNH00_gp26 [Yersinia phage PYps16N]QQO91199.1 hypothetical protein ORF026 [Yersinia phage PYps16N]